MIFLKHFALLIDAGFFFFSFLSFFNGQQALRSLGGVEQLFFLRIIFAFLNSLFCSSRNPPSPARCLAVPGCPVRRLLYVKITRFCGTHHTECKRPVGLNHPAICGERNVYINPVPPRILLCSCNSTVGTEGRGTPRFLGLEGRMSVACGLLTHPPSVPLRCSLLPTALRHRSLIFRKHIFPAALDLTECYTSGS